MLNKKLGFATLALGSFLTLLAPAAALAQDRGRDNNRQVTNQRNDLRNDDRNYADSFRNVRPNVQLERQRLERERLERERLERQRLEQLAQRRNQNRFQINVFNRSNQNSYGFRDTRGYYDKAGCWHSY